MLLAGGPANAAAQSFFAEASEGPLAEVRTSVPTESPAEGVGLARE